MGELTEFVISMIVLAGLAAQSVRSKWLTVNGAVVAFLIGAVMQASGEGVWLMLLSLFFVSSSILSKARRWNARRQEAELVYSKIGARDVWQVLANGGLALFIYLAYIVMDVHAALSLQLYVAVVAAVTADTWATEIGGTSRSLPVSILTWVRVPRGTSGAVSLRGSLAAVGGSMLIGWSAAVWEGGQWSLILYALIGGTVGSLVDSVMGASIQGLYQCNKCHLVTEKRLHCSEQTRLVRGHSWMNNDVVNFVASACAALTALIVVLL